MDTSTKIFARYRFSKQDKENLIQLKELLLPLSDRLANEFYEFLMSYPPTGAFFPTEEAVQRRKQTLKQWFELLFVTDFDRHLIRRLERIGKSHVEIGVKSRYVNAAMNFIREFCHHQISDIDIDPARKLDLLSTLNKVIDIHLEVITQSYQEETLKKVFVSYKMESFLVTWSERLLHGMNLILMLGLLAMAGGVVIMLLNDIVHAHTHDFEHGVISALGSLLLMWMLIELLHTEIEHLKGGKFHVRIFVELALVAFIRKLFVATLEHKDPVSIGLLLASLLVLGIVYFFVARMEEKSEARAPVQGRRPH